MAKLFKCRKLSPHFAYEAVEIVDFLDEVELYVAFLKHLRELWPEADGLVFHKDVKGVIEQPCLLLNGDHFLEVVYGQRLVRWTEAPKHVGIALTPVVGLLRAFVRGSNFSLFVLFRLFFLSPVTLKFTSG